MMMCIDILLFCLQEIPFGEVVGGPQSCFSFDLLMEIQTGNSFDWSDSVLRDIGVHVWWNCCETCTFFKTQGSKLPYLGYQNLYNYLI